MKLKLRGYILKRCDTNEYLKELVLSGDSAIVAWSTLPTDANLSKSQLDAMIVGSRISNAIRVTIKLYKRFESENDFLVLCVAKYNPIALADNVKPIKV